MRQIYQLAALAAAMVAVMPTGAAAQPQTPGHVITNPDWVKQPNKADLAQYYPAEGHGAEGKVELRCIVTSRGTLEKCVIDKETPSGHGFGTAAAAVAEATFQMRPQMMDGTPVGGAQVTFPFVFEGWDEPRNTFDPREIEMTVKVFSNPPWSSAPTSAQLAAAFPSQLANHVARGRVVLRCSMKAGGLIGGCETITEEPNNGAFAAAARGLIKDFTVVDDPDLRKQLKYASIDIPFEFRDPSAPLPPIEIVAPEWLTGPAGDIYPAEAAKRGITKGVGVVTCVVAHDGGLTHCAVVRENPEGLGFGATAVAAAGVMTMNPWTKQGFPVDGAKVTIPIQLNLDPTQAPPPAPKSP